MKKKVNLVNEGIHSLEVVKVKPLHGGGHQFIFKSMDQPSKDMILLKLPKANARTQVLSLKLFGTEKDELSAADRLSMQKSVIKAKITHSKNGLYADLDVETALILKGDSQSEVKKEKASAGQSNPDLL